MDVDGSNVKPLTKSGIGFSDFSWSPGGGRIVYESGGDIFIVSDDGAWGVTLINESCNVWEPAWSPNGEKIAYQSWEHNEESSSNAKIYVADVDGGIRERLTENTYYDDYPGWSPDGSKILFTIDPEENGKPICTP